MNVAQVFCSKEDNKLSETKNNPTLAFYNINYGDFVRAVIFFLRIPTESDIAVSFVADH